MIIYKDHVLDITGLSAFKKRNITFNDITHFALKLRNSIPDLYTCVTKTLDISAGVFDSGLISLLMVDLACKIFSLD